MSQDYKDPHNPRGVDFSRRAFLRNSGLVTVGAATLSGGLLSYENVRAQAEPSAVVEPGGLPVTLRVNGKAHMFIVEPTVTLAEVLRGPLNLIGTKIACNRGACGACTVWIDDAPVCSCMMLAIDVGRRSVTTIEGLARGESLHPIQTSFIEHDAIQCGFCTPGMVMSCAALIEHNSAPTLDDVKAVVSGHICRCGTYPKVFEATLAAARGNL
jgi:xanthine dehydrogenase YagT iron-sulfur-binding subunit